MSHGRVLALTEDQRLQIAAQAITQGPRARPVDAADRLVRPAVGRVPGDASSWTSRRCTLPTRWCGPTWDCRGWGSRSPSATIRARRPIARRYAYSRLVDTWGLLELPLLVSLTLPSSAEPIRWPIAKIQVLTSERERRVSPQTQAAWIERHVPLLAGEDRRCRWCCGTSFPMRLPHHYPHGGLFDAETSRSRRSNRCGRFGRRC